MRHRHFLERGNGLFGAVFLHEAEQGIQRDNGKDGDGVFRVAEEARHHRRADEDQHHGGSDLFP
jgi:hypothetical protein